LGKNQGNFKKVCSNLKMKKGDNLNGKLSKVTRKIFLKTKQQLRIVVLTPPTITAFLLQNRKRDIMDLEQLKIHLNKIANISNQEWMDGLDERKLEEHQFHNRDRDRAQIETLDKDTYEKFYSNLKFYSTVKKSTKYCENWIAEHANGKVFLDYACGNGGNAIKAAKAGAIISIGFDISDVSVRNAQEDAKMEGLENTFFFQADAENTKLPDGCVDTIICSGMLHHLDLSYAFKELQRILSPGGKILAVEALNYNPFIKLYRQLTPDMRTEWEKSHILSLKDVDFAKRFFDIGEIKYWHILSYAGAYFPRLLPFFEIIDSVFARIPGIRLIAWMFTFELLSKKCQKKEKIIGWPKPPQCPGHE
jgi:ubiquinone/menaquinone biosynthesis C-methylase UbiE